MINFPREVMQVEGCIAVVFKNGKDKGTPIVHLRTTIRYNGEDWKCSRLSYHLNKRQISCTPVHNKDQYVLHSCDNGWCVNPNHLYLGTQKQNIHDMYSRSTTVRKRISEKSTGRKHSEETKKIISESMTSLLTGQTGALSRRYGKMHSKETKDKISISKKANPTQYWLGKSRSEETRKKISDSLKGKRL